MTGPVFIEGAERGDVLAVTLMDIEPDRYSYTVIVPGFGSLLSTAKRPYPACLANGTGLERMNSR